MLKPNQHPDPAQKSAWPSLPSSFSSPAPVCSASCSRNPKTGLCKLPLSASNRSRAHRRFPITPHPPAAKFGHRTSHFGLPISCAASTTSSPNHPMLAPQIQTQHWPDRTTFDLPMRPIGAWRLIAADWLEGIAAEISAQMNLQGAKVVVEHVTGDESDAPAPVEEVVQQPPGSRINLVQHLQGIELTVPSRGLFKDSFGLLFIGAFWCLLLAAITAVAVLNPGSVSGSSSALPKVLAFAGFWAIGLAFLALGLHLGSRRWTLQADRQRLVIRVQSAFRSREWQWPASEIRTVCAGYSAVEVNDRRLEQLQIQPATGKPFGLLTGHDHAELLWLAATLRRALPARTRPDQPMTGT